MQPAWRFWRRSRFGPYLLIGMAFLALAMVTGLASGISWEQEELQYTGSQPAVAADGDNVYLVWTAGLPPDTYILYNWYNGSYWQGVGYVNTQPSSMLMDPDIAADNGVLHVVWSESKDGDADIFYSSFNGETWSTITQLNADRWSDDQSMPAIAVVGREVHVIWYDAGTNDRGIYYRHFDGKSWDNQEKVTDDTVPTAMGEENIDVAADRDGVHIVWGTTDLVVKYRHLDPTGWDDPESLDFGVAPAYMDQPCVATTMGVVYVAWDSAADGINITSNDGSGWSVPEVVGARTVDYLEAPNMAAEEGHVVLTWGSTPNGDIHFRHFNGTGWSDHEVVDNITTGRQYFPHLDLENGVVHLTYVHVQSGVYVYTRTGHIEMAPPVSGVYRSGPYWTGASGTDLDWWARDDFALARVTIEYRYSTDNATWSSWTEATVEDGVHGVEATGTFHFDPNGDDGYYQLRSMASDVLDKVEPTPAEADETLGRDTTSPAGTITVEGGADITSDPDVTLTITYEDATSGVAGIRVSNEAIGGDEPWEDPVSTLQWELLAGSGTRTVYLQVRDAVGLVSEVLSDDIIVDLDPPTGSIALDQAAFSDVVNVTWITLVLTFDDDVGVDRIRLSNDGNWDGVEWQVPTGSVAWQLPDGEGGRTVYYQVRDDAGRTSQEYRLYVEVDMTGPFLETIDPDDGSEDVPIDSDIVMVLSEAVAPASVRDELTVYWVDNNDIGHAVEGNLTWQGNWRTFTFRSTEDLREGTTFFIRLGPKVTDLAGNPLYPSVATSFTTTGQPPGEDGGDDDGDGFPWGIVVALLVVICIMAAAIMFLLMRRRPDPS